MNKIQEYKENYYGIKQGYNFIDFFIENITDEKKEKKYEVFNLKKKEYVVSSYSLDELEFLVQKLYTKFLFNDYLTETCWYKRLSDLLTQKFGISDVVNKVVIAVVIDVLVASLFGNSENEINRKEFLVYLSQNLYNLEKKDFESARKAANSFIDLLVDFKFIKISKITNCISIIDIDMFLSLKHLSILYPNIVHRTEFDICFDVKYSLDHLNLVIENFKKNLNVTSYIMLINLCLESNLYPVEKLQKFILDFSEIKYLPCDFVLDSNNKYFKQIMILLERVYLNKLVLNQYCFSLISVSFFKKFFHSKEKDASILFQKNHPLLNLNVSSINIDNYF